MPMDSKPFQLKEMYSCGCAESGAIPYVPNGGEVWILNVLWKYKVGTHYNTFITGGRDQRNPADTKRS